MSDRPALRALERKLLRAPRRRPFSSPEWTADVPPIAGVYGIWDVRRHCLIYIGETSDLQLRFRDLRRAVNHTFTKKVRGYLRVASSTSDQDVRSLMCKRFELAFLPVPFGRRELEEYLVIRFRATLINKPANRLLSGPQYQWVRPA